MMASGNRGLTGFTEPAGSASILEQQLSLGIFYVQL
jgi:hypothetical protein